MQCTNSATFRLWMFVIRDLARKEKNSVLCMNWEIKCNWGSGGGHCEPLSEFSGGPGGKALGTFTIFSLKLV